ncbi:MAG: DUF4301 family protein [Tannerellaceae bacterium]|jgi:hypothetical protein|nr:DUF4301 family protein [Tannerellaceae bacterium]
MLYENDLKLLASKGIREQQIEEQLSCFDKGFPFLEIIASASVEKGITVVPKEEQPVYMKAWEDYMLSRKLIVKFVPASGAASRMFKDLYAFMDADRTEPETPAERAFFNDIRRFAFFTDLNRACLDAEGADVAALIRGKQFKTIVNILLGKRGLNYRQLPKGLLKFHAYPAREARTALEEHLAEGAMYAKNNAGEVNIHFTVSPEHEELFRLCVTKKATALADRLSVKYNVSFSCQKPSTDTVAADADNRLFRDKDGLPVFRPGGHGALIENLNDLDCDVVFIKNIDNVTPDGLRHATVVYKKILAGLLVSVQSRIFEYLRLIDSGKYTHKKVEEMIRFLHNQLYIRRSDLKHLEDAELIIYIRSKLNRPLRVCGMVKNQGEPGGGPFIALNADGTVSPQILESSQIDLSRPDMKALFDSGTHFNPVDLVCALKDYRGRRFNLPDYVDRNAGFISVKSKDGRELKALELPGLWNGAMSNWNTVFVEVPIETFSPVKTVGDLLRSEHQG